VGTITEIYDYYRLLYTTVGHPYCPNHPHVELKKDTIQDVVDCMAKYGEGTKFHILIPIDHNRDFSKLSDVAIFVTDAGFVRFQIGDMTYSVADTFEDTPYTG
jgi:excinuclease ABC subunit A